MATAKKTGLIDTVKSTVSDLFTDKPARKSPKAVASGKKGATTRKTNEAATATKTAVKKAVTGAKKVATKVAKKAPAKAAKKTAAKRSRT